MRVSPLHLRAPHVSEAQTPLFVVSTETHCSRDFPPSPTNDVIPTQLRVYSTYITVRTSFLSFLFVCVSVCVMMLLSVGECRTTVWTMSMEFRRWFLSHGGSGTSIHTFLFSFVGPPLKDQDRRVGCFFE